jgi:GlpG protein
MTGLACLICIGVFLGVSRHAGNPNWDELSQWGLYQSPAIWDGAYWALVTSVFVHLQLWHVAFNVYWLWVLGRPLELAIGSLRWLLLFLFAAIVSSGLQLAASGTSGHGASGVVYALFGFMWVTRQRYPAFAQVLPPGIVRLFLIWLVGCFVVTFLGIFEIGNAAHLGGLLSGVAVAYAFVLRPDLRFLQLAPAALLVASVVPLFWCPWSPYWVGHQGYKAALRGDHAAAIQYYRRALALGIDPAWAWESIALSYHSAGDDDAARQALEELKRAKTDRPLKLRD